MRREAPEGNRVLGSVHLRLLIVVRDRDERPHTPVDRLVAYVADGCRTLPSLINASMGVGTMAITEAALSATEQRARYEDLGYVTYPTMLDGSEVAVLRAALDELLDEASRIPPDDGGLKGRDALTTSEKFSFTMSATGERHVRRIFNPIAHHQAFMDLVHNDKILDAVENLIGPDIQIHHTKLNLKPPSSPNARFEWHQDYPFFPHTNYDLIAVAIHIDESTEENGCLRVIPGIHKGGPLEHMFAADGAFSSQIRDQSVIPDESRWVNVTSPAGGVEMHHCNMVHSSTANRGVKPRSAVIIQYRAADNVQLSPYSPTQPGYGMLVRGTLPYKARMLDGSTVQLPTPIKDPTQRDG
jgi:phytanoyl-CoA hydroxylase